MNPRFVLIRYNKVTDSVITALNFQENGAFYVAIQGSIKVGQKAGGKDAWPTPVLWFPQEGMGNAQ